MISIGRFVFRQGMFLDKRHCNFFYSYWLNIKKRYITQSFKTHGRLVSISLFSFYKHIVRDKQITIRRDSLPPLA